MPEGSRRCCWLPQGGGSGLHGARPVQLVFREELPLPRRWVTGLGGVSAPVTPQREPDHRRSSALGATGVSLGQASPLGFPRPHRATAAGFGAEGSRWWRGVGVWEQLQLLATFRHRFNSPALGSGDPPPTSRSSAGALRALPPLVAGIHVPAVRVRLHRGGHGGFQVTPG